MSKEEIFEYLDKFALKKGCEHKFLRNKCVFCKGFRFPVSEIAKIFNDLTMMTIYNNLKTLRARKEVEYKYNVDMDNPRKSCILYWIEK